ncbi:predicted protein [Histoplasma capsulatum G186AR]|uniref:Uncharacterized protein n=2 Tax=Ajellomyces capsulatus TaxID=5037 RepID=C0NVL6_AJECG|nr:uncharacterized protein HCBG_07196 [Histoplasma capsulatum G186AR]EEH04555.1 predicted protein [Histoplasma capsulatum G186AR]KAG5296382.1 hypothetical protein I7I52_07015 [Histoplasma capsulatum]QSS74365.1 hypothetical protein I7I50_09494 [Histoplasma capsulatum G186AR]
MAYQDQHQQPYTNDEYTTPRAVICDELCYGCSTKRFAVAIRVTICVLTVGISEALRGKDGWCALCLEQPIAPPPRRSPSRATYVSQQPAQPPPMEMSVPVPKPTVTTTPSTPLPGGLQQHPRRKPSHGQQFPPPDSLNYSYGPRQLQPQQTQGFAETPQQLLPQFPQPPQPDQQIYPEPHHPQGIEQLQYHEELQQQQQHHQNQHHPSQGNIEYQQQQPGQVPNFSHSPPPQANQQLPWQQQPQQQPPIRISSPTYQQVVPQNGPSNMVPNTTHYMTPVADPNMAVNTAHHMAPNMNPNVVPNAMTPSMALNMTADIHAGYGAGGPGVHQQPPVNTPPSSVTSTPGRKPVNVVVAPLTMHTPPPQPPQEIHIPPALQIKRHSGRRNSSSSDSS